MFAHDRSGGRFPARENKSNEDARDARQVGQMQIILHGFVARKANGSTKILNLIPQ